MPIVPWLFASGATAVAVSLIVSTLLAVLVGIALSVVTQRSVVQGALRQVTLTLVSCGVTAVVGSLVGTAVG